VRVTENSCGQLPGVVTSANVSVTLLSQASVAVGVVKTGKAGHSTDEGSGSAEITGGVVSTTFTTLLHDTGPPVQFSHDTVSVKVNEPQLLPGETVTEEPVLEPTIEAPLVLGLSVQLCPGEAQVDVSMVDV